MRITKLVVVTSWSLASEMAHAQHAPTSIAVAALSPLAVVTLAVVLGMVAGSWRAGIMHAGLLLVWVLVFLFTVQHVENNYVIWIPIILYAAHTPLLFALLAVQIARRLASRDLLPQQTIQCVSCVRSDPPIAGCFTSASWHCSSKQPASIGSFNRALGGIGA
jgi:hypothetical protein